MKFPFVLASACFISGLLHPITVHAKAITISSADVAISDGKPPPATKVKVPPNKERAEEKSNEPAVDQNERVSAPKPQIVTSVAEERTSQRARSFFLLLHILQSAK